MQITDLVFIVSFLFSVFLLIRLLVLAIGKRRAAAQRTTVWLLGFLCLYGSALMVTASVMPRRFIAPGERHCFDDWCISALSAKRTNDTGMWKATVEVASEAKRVRQREAGITAELEDEQGRRFQTCPVGKETSKLTQELGPGDAVQVDLAFCLPAGAQVAGMVVRHGAFPGAVIIGDDESFLHKPALLRFK